MRRLAGLAIVLGFGAVAAGAHAADPAVAQASSAVLAGAPGGSLNGPFNGPEDGMSALLAKAAPATDSVPVSWNSSEFRFAPQTALRVRVGDPAMAGGHPLQAPGFTGAQTYELSLVRAWPGAVSFDTRSFGVDFTPHAGVGMTSFGGVAEAGATLRVSQKVSDAVKAKLNAMGVRDGASSFGDKGRWYLFAAASGRSVGLNMLRNDAGWSRAGWTTDQSSTLVGDAQLGVGWRKGDMQTSLGFVHREIRGLHNLYGADPPKGDSLVALSLSVRPGR